MVLTKWELADWEFLIEFEKEKIDTDAFTECLVLSESVLKILSNSGLLQVSKVDICEHRFASSPERKTDLHRKEQPIQFDYSQGGTVFRRDFLKRVKSEQSDENFYHPCEWTYRGNSTLFDAQGQTYDMDDAIHVDAWITSDSFSLSVETRTDVWLPYTIGGEPQPEVCRLNAPRLEAALEAIDRETALTFNDPEAVFSSRYCDINGFKLENTYYFDGEICRFNKRGQSILSPEDEDH